MSDDPLAEVTAIVRERYETGAYGDCHLRVADDVLAAVRTSAAREQQQWLMSGALVDLMSIPLVLDDTLAGGWQLVQWTYGQEPPHARTETILKEGALTR